MKTKQTIKNIMKSILSKLHLSVFVKTIERSVRKKKQHLDYFIRLTTLGKIKFNVGSGGTQSDSEWIATDIQTLDITKSNEWKKHLYFFKLDNIKAEHVWEHLTDEDCALANNNCFHFLKKNGVLRLAVPDGFHPDKEYIEYVIPGGHGLGADDHKILYNYKIMQHRLEEAGFKVNLLEYWDENGVFNAIDWSDDGGHIMRSKNNDRRNQNGELKYTSLIVDAVKL